MHHQIVTASEEVPFRFSFHPPLGHLKPSSCHSLHCDKLYVDREIGKSSHDRRYNQLLMIASLLTVVVHDDKGMFIHWVKYHEKICFCICFGRG